MNRCSSFLFVFVISILISGNKHFCFSEVYSGVVVESTKEGKGIPGVLVGAGYGLEQTETDSMGRFFLEVDNSDLRSPLVRQSYRNLIVRWNMRKRQIDLSAAPEVKIVSIYRPNGTCLWKETCRRISGKRFLTTPLMSPGLYLITFTRSDNVKFTGRAIHGIGDGYTVFSLPNFGIGSQNVAASSGGINLIFRHDRYYPLDRYIAAPSTDLVIPLQTDPTAEFFDVTKVHTFSFTLTNEDSLFMEQNALAEEYVPAELSVNGTPFGRVGLRYKGSNYYSMPRCFDEQGNRSSFEDCRNVPLKVKFNKYSDTLRLYGLKRLNLHSMQYDNSRLREMLAYELFRKNGIYTCRTVFIKVLVNGVSRGIFSGVEELDGRFTKSRWHESGDGNLYKEVWPIYDFKQKYREALVTNDNPEDNADVSRMVEFYHTINASTPQTFSEAISPFMDIDYWLRYIVVDRAIHNYDGVMLWYIGDGWMSNHNYFIYEDEKPDGKFWLIPWDLNSTFSETDPIFDGFGVPEWNETPDNCAPMVVWDDNNFAIPPNCDKLTNLTAAVYWNRFVSMGEQFLERLFTPEMMKERVDFWAKVIEPMMKDDPFLEYEAWINGVELLRSNMDILPTGFDEYIHSSGSAKD